MENNKSLKELVDSPLWQAFKAEMDKEKRNMLVGRYDENAGEKTIALQAISRQKTVELIDSVIRKIEQSARPKNVKTNVLR